MNTAHITDQVAPTIAVSRRALIQRINRRLAPIEQTLKVTRANSRWRNDLGDFYTVTWRNHIAGVHIDLEAYGREVKALEVWERLEEGGR